MSEPKKHVLVCCGHCQGTGKLEAPHLTEILDYIRDHSRVSTRQIHEGLALKCQMTGLNNRLADLEMLGLIERAGKDGRTLIWQLKEK